MSKRYATILVTFVLILVVTVVIMSVKLRMANVELGDTKRQHKQEIKASRHREDSLMSLAAASRNREALIAMNNKLNRDTLAIERSERIKAQKAYAKTQKYRVPVSTTNLELDSLVTRFLAEH